MAGLLRLEQAYKDNYASRPFTEKDVEKLDQLFSDLEKVNDVRFACENYKLNSEEIQLLNLRLNTIKSVDPLSFRTESVSDPQEELTYRTENFFKSIWDSIVKFFTWVGDTVSGWFSGDSSGGGDDTKPEDAKKSLETAFQGVPDKGKVVELNNLLGLERLVVFDNEVGFRQQLTFLGNSAKDLKDFGVVMNNITKEALSGTAKTKAQLIAAVVNGVKGKGHASHKDLFNGKINGEFGTFSIGKQELKAIGGSGEALQVAVAKLETKETPIKINANDLYRILDESVRTYNSFKELRAFLKGEFRTSSKNLANMVKSASQKEKTKEAEKKKIEIVRTLSEIMKEYISMSSKMQHNYGIFRTTLNKIPKGFEPFYKEEKASDTPKDPKDPKVTTIS